MAETFNRPKKSLGQNFLTNSAVADRIVELSGVVRGDNVLEIGPGRGFLTERLVSTGADVTAVELDDSLSEYLVERFGKNSNFRLIHSDILKVNLMEVFAEAEGRIKVVSNIPYNISSPIIDLLCRSRKKVASAVLMLQKEVAVRLLSWPGSRDYGLTTLNLSLYATGKKLMDVRPESFTPAPDVMSSVIWLGFVEGLNYPLSDEAVFRNLTGVAFRERRKMIRNTLAKYLLSLGFAKEETERVFEKAGIDGRLRPEDIGTAEYVSLSNIISGIRES